MLNPPTPRADAVMVNFHNYYIAVIGGTDGNRILRDICLYAVRFPSYRNGDVNNDRIFTGLDVVYAVAFLKGGPPPPLIVECDPCHRWYANGDVNGDCRFTGLDVTYMVSFLKGGPALIYCPSCEPEMW